MPSKPGNRPGPVKLVSEAVREHETCKYEPFLYTDFRFNDSGELLPSSEISSSKDSILTGLCQLGAYQTQTARSFISLFDATRQYVIAEAVPAMPITPSLPSDNCPEPLSLCGTAIPRRHGTCEHVLYLSAGFELDQCELPLSLVPDLATDDRFSWKPYCQFGGSGQFYAAVPIRTRRGINIGSYCVLNPQKPDVWDDKSVRRLRDISDAIMEHLERNRSNNAHRRNERMQRGLGSFIEGKTTITGWQSGPNMEAFADNGRSEGGLDVKQQKLERECQEEKDELPLHTDDLFPQIDLESYGHQRKANQAEPSVTTNGFLETPSPNPETIEQEPTYIFSKAANIIREAFEVEGCLFFDVTLGSYRTPKVHSLASGITAGATNQLSSTSSSDEQVQTSPSGEPDGPCKVLGFSTTLGSSINDTESFRGPDGEVSKQLLAKLLRRYPNGRIFSFDAVGELQSSDSSDDGGSLVTERTTDDISDPYVEAGGEELSTSRSRKPDRRYRRLQDGARIHEAFPSARSVAFFPIWDSKRERWLSGGFAYTLTPTRIFSIEGELSLLKAFGRLVASDVLNLQTLQTEKAKSDALGSISHELRSPLHGVILGTELLNDTDLTVFQGNATHTIETCCRTLLDTIDHLLDFSKVNNFAAKRKKEASAVFRRTRNRTRSDQFGKMSLYSYTSLDGLVEDVAECIFAGFNFQYMSVRQLSKPGESNQTDQEAHSRLDSVQAMEQLGPTPDGLGRSATTFNDVSISLSIEPGCNWVFHVPAGAIRRIVMNLFGNSLKYTTYGTIRISLSQEAPKRPREERTVKLTVHDTGKGMSEDYLQHGLFKPFSQEDELASGTGLGLSLVKKIVSQLRGKVFVESQVGFGTTVTVTIPLQQSSQHSDTTLLQSEDDKMFQKRVRELKGLRARVSGFESRQSLGDRGTIEDICQRWLLLAMVADNETPDVVLWSEDALPESFEQIEQLRKNPNIVVCQDALAAHERFALFESAGHGGIFEFISQPTGPRKLAKSILDSYKRWMGLPKLLAATRPPGPSRAHSSYAGQLPIGQTKLGAHTPLVPTTDTYPCHLQQVSAETSRISEYHSEESLTALSVEDTPLKSEQHEADNKILIVDDNHINLKILAAYMAKLGRAYEAASNGREALEAYTRIPDQFAGILMDISMPVMDGLEATRQIRAYERRNQWQAVTILALTGLASDSAHQEALESGVDVYLTKPVRLKVLQEVLVSVNILSLPLAGMDE